MKSIKVLYMGQRLRDVYPHATKFQVLKWRVKEFLKWCLRITTVGTIGATVIVGAFLIGQYSAPSHVSASNTIVEYKDSPVMDRIAGCESEGNRKSKGSHLDKSGKVRKNKNTNGTVDVGKYQINTVWFLTAMEMGYNLTDEKDNEEFAYWLYANQGTEPWYSSEKCWK